jgi:hypothetical protein
MNLKTNGIIWLRVPSTEWCRSIKYPSDRTPERFVIHGAEVVGYSHDGRNATVFFLMSNRPDGIGDFTSDKHYGKQVALKRPSARNAAEDTYTAEALEHWRQYDAEQPGNPFTVAEAAFKQQAPAAKKPKRFSFLNFLKGRK